MKKEKKGKKRAKVLVIILGVFLTFVVIMGVREINRFIHVGKITKIDSEEKYCISLMSVVYRDLFYIYESSNGCTYYVYYKDGSKESLSKALYLHHLNVNDAAKFGVNLNSQSVLSRLIKNTKHLWYSYIEQQ